jgi:membrane protein DedA with SNARE-associated domain/rhodanese-related sulfurtransferase
MGSNTTQFLIAHGLPLVFLAVFVDQIGVPLPAAPWLLAAGALSATGKFSFAAGLGFTMVACLVADAFWFYLGRYRGNQVVRLLCRISLEPDSCVRRTQNVFSKYGLRGLLVAKFLPGMGTVAPPLAGMSKIRGRRFFFVDAIGALLYGGTFLGAGFFFSNQIEQIGAALARIGGSALSLILGLALLYIAFKYWQRHRLLRELRMARITVNELRQKLDAGENMVILDLRSSAALTEDPTIIQGAIHVSLDDFEKRQIEIPRDRDVIVYCSCPNEASSARLALRLQRKGFTRVRPLLGGIDAWRALNHPMQPWSATPVTSASGSASAAGATARPAQFLVKDPNQTGRNPEGKAA